MGSRLKRDGSGTRIYRIWLGMRARCSGRTCKRTKAAYKDKGVTVCKEWETSYTNFKLWATQSGYTDKLSIDRIDNDGNYSPENCRWTTQLVQSANTRVLYKHNKSGYRGVSWNKGYSKWEVSISVNRKTVKIGYYTTVVEAAQAYDTYIEDNSLPHTSNSTNVRTESNVGKLLISTNTSGYIGVTSPIRIKHLDKPWSAQVNKKSVRVFDMYCKTSLEAALRREIYIVKNCATNKRNFKDLDLEDLQKKLTKLH